MSSEHAAEALHLVAVHSFRNLRASQQRSEWLLTELDRTQFWSAYSDHFSPYQGFFLEYQTRIGVEVHWGALARLVSLIVTKFD